VGGPGFPSSIIKERKAHVSELQSPSQLCGSHLSAELSAHAVGGATVQDWGSAQLSSLAGCVLDAACLPFEAGEVSSSGLGSF
jgi:hypothetical protein